MNTEALLRVAEMLERENPPTQDRLGPEIVAFDMSSWAEPEFSYDPKEGETAICGTSACACGHAALDPWFQERGLELALLDIHTGRQTYTVMRSAQHLTQTMAHRAREGLPQTYSILHTKPGTKIIYEAGLDGVAGFFDITPADATVMFGGIGTHRTPLEVAAVIRRFLANPANPWNEEEREAAAAEGVDLTHLEAELPSEMEVA